MDTFLTNQSPIHVLVVEDELFSRLHAVDLIERAGYAAVEAANADEAIAILEARKDIRIVFTDIDMPGSMDGLKLSHAIASAGPQSNLFSRRDTLTLVMTNYPSVGDFSQSHIVMRRLFRRYDTSLLKRSDNATPNLRGSKRLPIEH